MKKIIALALALVLTLSCAAALADSYEQTERNMTNRVSTENTVPNFEVTKKSTTEGLAGAAMEAQQHTDVWLQVEASGQIDITVPLVAVFKTNIDGGRNTISDSYKLINYSSAAIAVTKLEIKDQKYDVTTNGNTSNMELVDGDSLEGVYNKYALFVLPEDQYNIDKPLTANKRWQLAQDVANKKSHQESPLMSTAFTLIGGDTWTLDSEAKAGDEKLGLWLIDRSPADGSGNSSKVTLTLDTSKLSFVTQKADSTNDPTGDPKVENGVKLFTITYTVKIDDSNAKGEDIYGTTNGTEYDESKEPAAQSTHAYEYMGLITNDKGEKK